MSDENLPTKSLSSTEWKLNHLTYLEDSFGDSKALQAGIDNIVEALPGALPELMNNIVYYINDAEALEASLDEQIKALSERRDRFKKRAENLREALKKAFNTFGLTKLECPLATISKVTKPSSKLVIEDEGELMMNNPELFVKAEPKINKPLLTEKLKAGENITGAKLIDSVTISIRK